jgi:hypothetical protein
MPDPLGIYAYCIGDAGLLSSSSSQRLSLISCYCARTLATLELPRLLFFENSTPYTIGYLQSLPGYKSLPPRLQFYRTRAGQLWLPVAPAP